MAILRQYAFFAAVLALCLAAALVFFIYQPVERVLAELNLTPQNEPLTELYFTGILPKASLESAAPFSFTIHNLEGRRVDYPYTVLLESQGGSRIIDSGTVSLEDNGSASMQETLPVVRAASVVVVGLPEQGLSIHFSAGS
ncbi:MAG: hypothetical protein KGH79_00045 [Patescibacteria group bacterium]|nr:hypothetical protein [Patescibacteria group bacterium]